MDGTRRSFLKAAVTAAGAAATTDLAQANGVGPVQGDAHQAIPSDLTLRVKSLESLLVEKGLVDRAALDALIDTMEHKVGPRNGARVVARAWVDPAYKKRLLENAPAAIAELGYTSGQGEHMVVVENTPKVHNLVVCTLCSCYPWPVLGLPPVWYKSRPTDPERSSIRAASSKSLERTSRKTSRCAYGTAPRSCATSCCPNVPPAPRR